MDSGEPLSCDDGNPCTLDSEGSEGACAYEPVVDGTPCPSDGDPCTWDVCGDGVCGVPRTGRVYDELGALRGARPVGDDGWVFVGQQTTAGGAEDTPWIVRVGPDGESGWDRLVPGGGSLADLDVLEDGSILAVGSWEEVAGEKDLAWGVRLTADGDIAWERTYGDATASFGAWVVHRRPGGGWLVGGSTAPIAATQPGDPWLLGLDSSGEPALERTYADGVGGISALVVEDSGEALWTSQVPAIVGDATKRPWLVRTDSFGSLKSERRVEAPGAAASDLLALPGGGVALVGVAYETGDKIPGDLWLARADDDGVPWQRQYGEADALEQGYGVAPAPDGGYWVAGWGSQDIYRMWLLRTDGSGALIWDRTYVCNTCATTVGWGSDVLAVERGALVAGELGQRAAWVLVDEDGERCADRE